MWMECVVSLFHNNLFVSAHFSMTYLTSGSEWCHRYTLLTRMVNDSQIIFHINSHWKPSHCLYAEFMRLHSKPTTPAFTVYKSHLFVLLCHQEINLYILVIPRKKPQIFACVGLCTLLMHILAFISQVIEELSLVALFCGWFVLKTLAIRKM